MLFSIFEVGIILSPTVLGCFYFYSHGCGVYIVYSGEVFYLFLSQSAHRCCVGCWGGWGYLLICRAIDKYTFWCEVVGNQEINGIKAHMTRESARQKSLFKHLQTGKRPKKIIPVIFQYLTGVLFTCTDIIFQFIQVVS